jgi:hypothetical protein
LIISFLFDYLFTVLHAFADVPFVCLSVLEAHTGDCVILANVGDPSARAADKQLGFVFEVHLDEAVGQHKQNAVRYLHPSLHKDLLGAVRDGCLQFGALALVAALEVSCKVVEQHYLLANVFGRR